MIPGPHRKKAGAVAIAAGLLCGFEGLRHTVYLDPIGVPTYCVGETKNPRAGHTYSTDECMTILEGRVAEFARGVDGCVLPELSPERKAASISLAYNIGIHGFCRSSVVRLFNTGQADAACDAFLKFNRAGGIVFRGLTRRREAERELCMKG